MIEGALFQGIGNDEILRYFSVKGSEKSKAAPHLSAIFEHFNRVSHIPLYIAASLQASEHVVMEPCLSIYLDVIVLHVESAHSAVLCGQEQDPGVSDPGGLGVLPTPQL